MIKKEFIAILGNSANLSLMKGTLAVVGGLGYVGLPLAVLSQEKGWNVNAIDTDSKKVKDVNNGICPLADDQLAADLKKYPIEATDDFSAANGADIIIITVPTPVTESKEPDLSPLKNAINSILPHLNNQLVIVESTINPGVMDEVVSPLLADSKVDIAYCPERINPGDKQWTVRNIPRVLGSYTDAGMKKAKDFYSSILEAPIKIMNSVTEAEAVKIVENTFRDINIAFVNEMARSFDALKIDVVNVIDGAATKPFAFMAHYPGSGVGGHCISVDPYYMISRGQHVGFDHEFLKLARQINESMPAYTVDLLLKAFQEKSIDLEKATVTLLGLSYKPNVADTRESPCHVIKNLLSDIFKNINIFDPYVVTESTHKTLAQAIKNSEAIILGTAHTEFLNQLTPDKLITAGVKIVIDGRNALDQTAITQAGIYYHGIGRS